MRIKQVAALALTRLLPTRRLAPLALTRLLPTRRLVAPQAGDRRHRAGVSAFSLATHQGLQGQFAVHAVASTDIAAARYFYSHAPAGSSLLLGAQNFPARLTADVQFFGDLPTGALAALDDALRASPRWDVFYQAPGVTIFRLRAAG